MDKLKPMWPESKGSNNTNISSLKDPNRSRIKSAVVKKTKINAVRSDEQDKDVVVMNYGDEATQIKEDMFKKI